MVYIERAVGAGRVNIDTALIVLEVFCNCEGDGGRAYLEEGLCDRYLIGGDVDRASHN